MHLKYTDHYPTLKSTLILFLPFPKNKQEANRSLSNIYTDNLPPSYKGRI